MVDHLAGVETRTQELDLWAVLEPATVTQSRVGRQPLWASFFTGKHEAEKYAASVYAGRGGYEKILIVKVKKAIMER